MNKRGKNKNRVKNKEDCVIEEWLTRKSE